MPSGTKETPPPPWADIAIIGGGPAGTTMGTLLAQKGWKVVLFEKEAFPRFHIGESLLPRNLPILDRLGVLEQTHRLGIPKYGAEFIPDITGRAPKTFYFGQSLKPSPQKAYEVPRAEFDQMLLTNAEKHGAQVSQPTKVTGVDLGTGQTPHQVKFATSDGQARSCHCSFVVDASGRHTLLGRHLGWKRKNPRHNMAALYAHCTNVPRREGLDAGNISIYWFQSGWIWMIPLPGGITSVGVVAHANFLRHREQSVAELFWDSLRRCPQAWERINEAHLVGEVSATGNYAYGARKAFGNRFLLAGDAYSFLDPVFSSGVLFAMRGGELGATAVDTALRKPSRHWLVLRRHQSRVDRTLNRLSWFIYRFNTPAMQLLFSGPEKGSEARPPKGRAWIEASVTSLLGGDFFYPQHIRLPLTLFKLVYLASALSGYFEKASAATRKIVGPNRRPPAEKGK